MSLDPRELAVPPSPAVMVEGTSSSDPADISAAMARSFRTLGQGAHAPGATYGRIAAWMIEQGYMTPETDWARDSPMWEEYVDDPDTTPPEQLRTFIYIPRRNA